jgi:hypothetical protein
MAHRGQKLQFEIIAVFGLLALFTREHIFWVMGLILALIDIPDFGTPLGRIVGSLENIGSPRGWSRSQSRRCRPTRTCCRQLMLRNAGTDQSCEAELSEKRWTEEHHD